jgi:hypothetical protein
MAKYLITFQSNLNAPWPQDPAEYLEVNEQLWAFAEDFMKKGLVKDLGFGLDQVSGYVIAEGEAAEVYSAMGMALPYLLCDVREVVSFEEGRELDRARLKAQIEAVKK